MEAGGLTQLAPAFTGFGALFLAGLAADTLGRRTRLPRVTLLLLLGIAVGPSALGLIPAAALNLYEALSAVALTMVAFLLGGSLTRDRLSERGRAILCVSGMVVVVTVIGLTLGLMLIGVPPELALLLGAIATATDPAATQETLRETAARGRFADTLRGVVAIDDAWGMIVFALAMVGAQALASGGVETGHVTGALREIGGATVLGVVIGLPGAYLTGRLKPGEPTQLEALGLVFLTAGVALWLNLSFLLAGMVAGAVIANRARHHERAFHEIELIERPFLILFFLLAGAAMELGALWQVGALGLGYVVLRIAARLVGGWIGGRLGGLSAQDSRWIGPALLPQAGVAVGMALIAAQSFPAHAETILTLTIGTTVVFELIGPLATAQAVRRASRD
ncbi:cation:proton antiporter [Tropicibacter oceani]|uniref:Cation:proton antiporter n=1 Tax=Tropicibacter oceani TaxID=3058420 RepID=A0ABY8QKQ4_9RHOB|nr:cation:proton antiporter [Tropicibacter oceani]WGW05023.1 cation:proton antiporter [Tropicibacter oceani]